MLQNQPITERYTIKERLMILRALSCHDSRKAFAESVGIPCPTLESWERGHNNLSLKGAQRLLKKLATMGVYCSEEWLLYCTGAAPTLASSRKHDITHNIKNLPSEWTIPSRILGEIEVFLQSNPLSIVAIITDDSMLPTYSVSDIVGGLQINNISQGLQKNVIVELNTSKVLIRRLMRGSSEYKYSLTSVNPQTNVVDPVLFNANIKKCHIIVWHRIISRYDLENTAQQTIHVQN